MSLLQIKSLILFYIKKISFSFPHNLSDQNIYQNYFTYNLYSSNIVIIDFSQKLFINDKVISKKNSKNLHSMALLNKYSLDYKFKEFEIYVIN